MKISFGNCVLYIVFLSFIFSCTSRKGLVYMQNIDSIGLENRTLNFEPKLQPDDLLSIIVSAETPEVTMPFNLPQIQGNYQVGNNQNGIKTYLIDAFGNIDFPVIGKVKLGGLSRTEANDKLVAEVSAYITNPSINLRILNYKISVLGEVVQPGNYVVSSERITLLEALSLAGDLTIYGQRNNILIIRENDAKKNFTRVDITKADFMTSEFYYLKQNDVIVVEPNNTRVNASVVGPNLSLILSALTLLTTVVVIILR